MRQNLQSHPEVTPVLADSAGQPQTTVNQDAPFAVRNARREDGAALAAVYNDAIRSGRSTMDTEPVSGEYFREFLQPGSRQALLAGLLDEAVVGWGVVKRYSDRPGYRLACETSVYLGDGYQGRGFGGALQSAVMEQARVLGYRHLVAKIMAVNEHSIRFHESFGFEHVGRQRNIGCLHGKWHDIVIMQYVFSEHAS